MITGPSKAEVKNCGKNCKVSAKKLFSADLMEQALNNFECWTDTNGDRIKFRDKSECRQNLPLPCLMLKKYGKQ